MIKMRHYIRILKPKEDYKRIYNKTLSIIEGMESKGLWNKHPIELVIEDIEKYQYVGCIDMSCNKFLNSFVLTLKFNMFHMINDINILGEKNIDLYLMKQILHEYRHYLQWCYAYEVNKLEGVYKMGVYNNSHNKDNILEEDANNYAQGIDKDISEVMRIILKQR